MVSFRILGPVQALADERELPLGGRRQLTLLAFLLLNANRAVSNDALTEAVWGPARAADNRLQMAIARLRKALEPPNGPNGRRLITVSGGYMLTIEPDDLDAHLFAQYILAGRAALDADDPAKATEHLDAGLALWRGPPLSQVAFEDFAQPEIRRLEELRLTAIETRIDAQLQLGHHGGLVGDLESLLARFPTRERLACQLMLVLYRTGRQAHALEIYQRTRAHLASELGLEPGPALKTLQAQILEQEQGLVTTSIPAAIPANRPIPNPPTVTLGRAPEIEAVCRALQDQHIRLLTLVGPGGVGKTRLALEVAHALRSHMPDGVGWVELAGVSRPEDVGATIVRALAVVPTPGERPAEALTRFLAAKRLLLVVDNFEHVLAAAELLAELIRVCAGVRILATSREALNLSAERRFSVTPLALPVSADAARVDEIESTAATALFLDAARRRDSGLTVTPVTAPLIARICTRLDGLPLAIELAAARTEFLGVEQLATRLASLTNLGSGPRDAPARQRTLSATIDWSYQLLDSEQQTAFGRFAVFAGGATHEAAEAVTGANLGTLEALVVKHLLRRSVAPDGSTRLVILETLREYASERLAEDPNADAVHRRHFETCQRLVEEAVPHLYTHSDATAMATIEADLDNLLLALRWGLAHEPRGALRIAGLLGEYWWLSDASDGLQWLDAALEVAGENASLQDRAHAELVRAYQFVMAGRIAAAHDAMAAALRMYERAADDRGVSLTSVHLAMIKSWLGDPEGSRALSDAACRRARLTGDRALLGKVLAVGIGNVPADERQAALEEAAGLLVQAGDYRHLQAAYENCGDAALKARHLDEALRLFELAHEAARKATSPWLQMGLLDNIAVTNLLAGDFSRAREHYATELNLGATHGFHSNPELLLAGLGALAVTDGDWARAARLLGAARSLGYPPVSEKVIVDWLERDFFAPARERFGDVAWRNAEQVGALLCRDDAIACAHETLTEVARLDHHRRRVRATA